MYFRVKTMSVVWWATIDIKDIMGNYIFTYDVFTQSVFS